jgi:alkylation response protein AidB-like acyl-CoA dehydrogenase
MGQMAFDDEDGMLSILRDSVAGFAERFPGPQTLRTRRAAGGDIDRAVWSAMAEAGWLGLLLPAEDGGSGLTLREQAVLSEALGRALVTEPLAQLAVFAGTLLRAAPASAERTRLTQGIADGSLLVTAAWQGADGEPAPLKTAPRDGGITLDGKAHFVTAPASATDIIALATSNDGPILVSVPADHAGVSVEQRPSIDGSRIGALSFHHCHIESTKIIARGNSVMAVLDEAIDTTRLVLAAELAGVASQAMEMAVAYTKQRVQFGKSIASFQAIQHRLVDMWGDAEFACAAVVNAVERNLGNGGTSGKLAVLAAKARAGDAAVTISRRAIHLYGAMGFTDECDIGLYMKRAVNLNATLGQPETLRLQFLALERTA